MRFEDILRDVNWPVAPEGHEHRRQGWLNFDCPHCRLKQHYRMGYNLAYRYVNCWACGPHKLIDTLMEITGLSYGKVKELTGDLTAQRDRAAPILRGKLVLPKWLGELLPAHRRYLQSRGFDPERLVKLWGIQGIGNSLRLKWRIFIPFIHHGETVSWTTRSISDEGVRYLSAKPEQEAIAAKKELLYGEDYVRHAVIVHEGPTDVWATGPGAVGTWGTGFSQAQVLRISKYPTRVICFDSERTAQKRAKDLCNALEVFPGRTMNVVLDAKDAGSAKPRELRQLRKLIGVRT